MTDTLKIIGISTRTTNKNNQAQIDLSNLWNRFFAENIAAQITNKLSADIYTVYTDYKSDFNDEYTTIIGFSVANLNNIPNGLIGREFKQETFKKYIAKGKMPDVVIKTWMEIWQNDSELNRKYSYDLEIYKQNCENESMPEVEIHIAMK